MQLRAYGALVDMFNKYESRTIQIEILPPAISPPEGSLLLEDEEEGSAGIPKAVIFNAFLAARKVFFETRHALTGPSALQAMDATRIMLLFDPEHLTAANYRKRYLLAAQREGTAGQSDLAILVRKDLMFLFTLFSSPLFRHTKSPTLWSHCLWIARNYWDIEIAWAQDVAGDACEGDSSVDEKTAVSRWLISQHWEKVKDATTSHPKNYHAWHFMRKFVQLLSERLGDKPECGYQSEFARLLQETHQWCLKNPSDTSGWAFLSFMFCRREARGHEDLIGEIMENVLALVYDFRWRHESIWTFIRTVLAARNLIPEDSRAKLIHDLEEKYTNDGSSDGNAPETGIAPPHPAALALKWIHNNSSAG
ncbi:uncharacterized protein J3D65DRAFT_547788 [Phyllosticta citribraziliensis]|uniref:Protein prenyltransferase n=1 Tax=Phyllosticta citribraziliensis TaxID=989973 RepID=A0ABR1M5R4_9PEZI